MAKIREDLIGAVHVDGHVLFAGDAVPSGVKVGSYLTAAEAKATKAEPKLVQDVQDEKPKPKRGRPRKNPVGDTGDAEVE